MKIEEIVFDVRDISDGFTEILGFLKLQDDRQAAAVERIHGKEYVCPLPGNGYWVKLPQYDLIEDRARKIIAQRIAALVESEQDAGRRDPPMIATDGLLWTGLGMWLGGA
jgi:hypothetical protein